ncbi:uncharacterized protein LOC124931394 isoform X2 [Impatiens glandulifera]|uniref:uncharacterized protein LOC124931394 isoform X2 n=1 Tax=Impatiens glandulifera TaxID=253017 RepID=UPI001FB0A86B|nr:uncharacterized protein LOC124931394 isoform X2 [Impatiens glandulifera]
MPPPKVSRGFSFFGGGSSSSTGGDDTVNKFGGRDDTQKKSVRLEDLASLKLQTDKDVYRPGDPVLITIEIRNNNSHSEVAHVNEDSSLLIENMTFEMKGIEKLDTQWFATQKPTPDSKQKRGEYIFMECSTMTVISNQVISSGGTRTYLVRTCLPSIVPPSFRGSTIRYTYYVRSTLSGRHMTFGDDHSGRRFINALSQLEARIPLQVWLSQKSNGLPIEEGWTDGIVPPSTIFLDAYWKEMDGESDWARLSETNDEVEEGYESSRDEISSVSSYNPNKNNITKAFGSSLSLQSSASRSSMKERNSISNNMSPPQLAVSEVLYDSGADFPTSARSSTFSSPVQRPISRKSVSTEDSRLLSDPGAVESVASEGFLRGRSYNFRLDDQVLLRFSPKNPDSSYYLSDMIGGTLTFFHEKGLRRCLELSVTLQMSETINRRSVHPSRKHSPTITKVQSDHHEVVADLVQTSFLFSIPMDGPMSFSTPHVSIQWALCFEFYTTPKNVDWTRYEHPLLVDGRDKCEWVLPITVHAPPGAPSFQLRNEKTAFPSESLWVRT